MRVTSTANYQLAVVGKQMIYELLVLPKNYYCVYTVDKVACYKQDAHLETGPTNISKNFSSVI